MEYNRLSIRLYHSVDIKYVGFHWNIEKKDGAARRLRRHADDFMS